MRLDGDERDALALTPLAKSIADDVRAKLPEGTHFAVFVLAPTSTPGEGRVIAVTSDREVMLPNVAQWVMSLLRATRGE